MNKRRSAIICLVATLLFLSVFAPMAGAAEEKMAVVTVPACMT